MKDIAKGIVYLGVFAIPFIPLIISNTMFFPFITGKNFTFRVIVEIIFAAWILLALYEPLYRPRFSWIVAGFTSLLVVMFFANLFGANPLQSFWSNFERMEGYVTLVHMFLYFLVAGSVLTTDKLWNRFFNTTLFAAVLLSLYAFAQLSGNIVINQGGWRLDGTLGNSAYMAIYMLFHSFIALFMLVRTRTRGLQYTYGALLILFIFLLIQTATRGSIIGFFGGLFVTTLYITLFIKDHPRVRKVAISSLVAVVALVGLFVAFRDSALIQSNPYLGRVANITLSEGNVRFKVWNMAIEGFKERPVLGWGQSNFNYVFNEHYDPSIYFAESWYDRVHDIAFDWLIAGGVLGFIAYFSILAAALYYLFFRPLFKKDDESMTVVERGVLLGLLAGYVFHNIFVFDNIVSYVYYGTILAFIHSRVASAIPKVAAAKFDTRVLEQIATPVVGVALLFVIYFVNAPGIRAASDIIDAFSTQSPDAAFQQFDEALSRNSFGNQEIREQLTRQAQALIQDPKADAALKEKVKARVEEELIKQIEEKPNDARVHVFISSFYRMTGDIDKAIEQLEIARSLSPQKQQIIFEQGLAHLQKGENDIALAYFKEAYDLAPSYSEAAVFYAVAGLFAGKPEIIDEVLTTKELRDSFSENDLAVQAAYSTKQFDVLENIFKTRIERKPEDPQARTNLAFILNEQGKTTEAIEILNQAAKDIPSFEGQSQQFIASLLAGNSPTTSPVAP